MTESGVQLPHSSHEMKGTAAARSPIEKPETPGPSASIVPLASIPMRDGKAGLAT